ncbi:MAG: hypothetical protein ACYC23_16675 [Limisphaerales bacterium]
MPAPSQAEFDFSAATRTDGLESWRESRRLAAVALSRSLGLPLEHVVEVRLKDGTLLEGPLQLQEETLFPDHLNICDLELRVGRVNFRHSEIESCTRQD